MFACSSTGDCLLANVVTNVMTTENEEHGAHARIFSLSSQTSICLSMITAVCTSSTGAAFP